MSRSITVLVLATLATGAVGCSFDGSGLASPGGGDDPDAVVPLPDAMVPVPDAAMPPADYQAIEGEPGAYRMIATPAALASAATDCADDGPGAHLVMIDRAAEDIAVRAHADELLDGDRVWIGITDRAVEGSWLTLDARAVEYTNWKAGEPNDSNNEDCAIVLGADDPPGHHGQWNDVDCDRPFPYVCEWGPVL